MAAYDANLKLEWHKLNRTQIGRKSKRNEKKNYAVPVEGKN